MESDRFGLPLSLVEALEADPSPQAAQLAELLADATAVRRAPRTAARGPGRPSGPALLIAGLAVVMGVGLQGHAMAASLEGRWVMVGPKSSFAETVTGAAPDSAILTVLRDDADRLVYRLSEARDGVEVARGAYDVSFVGGPSQSQADGSSLAVTADRTAREDVTIRAPKVGALQAVIRLRLNGPDTAILEHDVESDGRTIPLERLSLVRDGSPPTPAPTRSTPALTPENDSGE